MKEKALMTVEMTFDLDFMIHFQQSLNVQWEVGMLKSFMFLSDVL